MRDGFIIHEEYFKQIGMLSDAQIGVLIKQLIQIYSGNEELTTGDLPVDILVSVMSGRMRRDGEYYSKQARNGRRGGRPDETQKKPDEKNETQKKPPVPVPVPVPDPVPNTTPLPPPEGETDAQSVEGTNEKAAGDTKVAGEKHKLQDQRFSEFWAAYPNKKSKERAKRAWTKLKPTAELFARIMEAIEVQKDSAEWQKDHGAYIPHPATWLHNGDWENVVTPASEARARGPTRKALQGWAPKEQRQYDFDLLEKEITGEVWTSGN